MKIKLVWSTSILISLEMELLLTILLELMNVM